jgi:N6-adenosine-specific RNA methylase IME4
MRGTVLEPVAAIVRQAERTDEEIVALCKEAMEVSNKSSWEVADYYYELNERRSWTQQEIADEFAVSQQFVCRLVTCVAFNNPGSNRPPFLEVYRQPASQLRARRPGNVAPPLDPCTVDDLQKLIDARVKCGTILADPPWPYDNTATRAHVGGADENGKPNHYRTMTVEQICALGGTVRQLAADAAHLWLWTTNAFLFACPDIFDAWGFEFKSSYVWCKHQFGMGNYLRNAHEFLLLASRGGLVGAAKDVRSWDAFDRTEHSTKPDQIRFTVIEKVSPGPRLELFGRRDVDGWFVWGDQIEHSLFARKIGDHAEREAS